MTSIHRREFLARSAGAAALSAGYFVNPSRGEDSKSPNEKLNIAAIGATGRAGADIHGVASQTIVAIADVDQNLLEKGGAAFPDARRYRDFRVMLEKEAEKIDAVVVGTPDHTHAPAAAMAMRLGKHVYCEKPLTHTVYEARVLANLAKEHKLVTQMGTQIHAGDNYRRVVELVQSGAIGKVREAHVWVGVNYTGRHYGPAQPAPKNLDWDLWLGPAPQRPYSESVIGGKTEVIHPFNWRWFWEYGTGGLGDFGCHYMDLVHWALELRAPTKISADGPAPHPESTTAGLMVKYEYPARGDLPPVALTWYDGGRRPEILDSLKGTDGKPLNWGSGQLFVGERGMIISDYGRHLLLPVEKFADFKRPDPFIPRSIGHHNEWIEAVKTGGPTTCNFDYSGALTEAVLLGVAAYRSGQTIEWDAANLKVTNALAAQEFIHKEYRKGWTL
jgi:predicted dehydrogenase